MRKTLDRLTAAFKETYPILTFYLLFVVYIASAEVMVYYRDLKRLLSALEIANGTTTILLMLGLTSLLFYLLLLIPYTMIRACLSSKTAGRIAGLLRAGSAFLVLGLWISSSLFLARKVVFFPYLPKELPVTLKLSLLIIMCTVLLNLAVKAYRTADPRYCKFALKLCFFIFAIALLVFPFRFMADTKPSTAHSERPEYTQAVQSGHPHVILILIDSAMADYFSTYGYSKETSPRLSELAKESFLFTRFYPCSFPTLPSVTSIYTSMYSMTHGRLTWFDGYPKPQESLFDTIKPVYDSHFIGISPESFGFAGNVQYRDTKTFGFLNRTIFHDKTALLRLRKIWRFYERFYVNSAEDFELVANAFRESDSVLKTLDWVLEEKGSRPLFLHLHLMNLHPPLYRESRNDSPSSVKPYVNKYLGKLALPEGVLTDIEDAYCAQVRNVDDMIGRIIDKLRLCAILEESILVVTSDHNIFLGLDKKRSTPFCGAPEVPVRRIPLIIRIPGKKGGRIDQISDHTDIAPTLLDAVGLNKPPYMQGSSLWQIMAPSPGQAVHPTEKRYALYCASHDYPLDSFQIIDDHIFVYDMKERTGRIFDRFYNVVANRDLDRKYLKIARQWLRLKD